jgi:hypothetical protein
MAISSHHFRAASARVASFERQDGSVGAAGPGISLWSALAPVVLALFLGFVWFAYSKGVELAEARAPQLTGASTGFVETGPGVLTTAFTVPQGRSDVAPLPTRKPVRADISSVRLQPSAETAIAAGPEHGSRNAASTPSPAPQRAAAGAALDPPAPPSVSTKETEIAIAAIKPRAPTLLALPDSVSAALAPIASPAIEPQRPELDVAALAPVSLPSIAAPVEIEVNAPGESATPQIEPDADDASARSSWQALKDEVSSAIRGVTRRITSSEDTPAAAAGCEAANAQGADCAP